MCTFFAALLPAQTAWLLTLLTEALPALPVKLAGYRPQAYCCLTQ